MPTINKALMRLAAAIHTKLAGRRTNEPLIEMPVRLWERCTDLVRQIRRAQLRGWNLAANALSRDLECSIPSVLIEVTALQQRLTCRTGRQRLVTASDVYRDLVTLGDEFEDIDYDSKLCRLSVTTEPIVLEGVYLGPFEIQLQWARANNDGDPAYRVIAKDAHPAESRENVTHPHVMDEILCEGDGKHGIRRALSEGRLLDFFTLVAGVLRTYNPESPFVELALWSGSNCSDCGALVDEDYSYSCQKCGDTICGECETVCGGCDDSCCSGCIGSCAACEESFCRRCLKTCEACHRHVCSGCLDHQERCTKCHEDESENEDGGSDSPANGATLQPNGLVEAFTPA
jgi:hypothetical protein